MHIMVHPFAPLCCSRFLPLQPDISASDHAALSVTAVGNIEIHLSCNRLSESDIQRCAGRVLWDLQETSRNGEARFVCHTTSVFLTVAFFSLTVREVKCSHLCDSFPFAWPDLELWLKRGGLVSWCKHAHNIWVVILKVLQGKTNLSKSASVLFHYKKPEIQITENVGYATWCVWNIEHMKMWRPNDVESIALQFCSFKWCIQGLRSLHICLHWQKLLHASSLNSD